jgi:hypothetical protein
MINLGGVALAPEAAIITGEATLVTWPAGTIVGAPAGRQAILERNG